MTTARRRIRQALTLVVLAVSVVAIAATSPASTSIYLPDVPGTLHLDADHPAALARIVVNINPEATYGGAYYQIHLRVESVAPAAGGTHVPFDVTAARFIVVSAAPGGAMPGAVPGLPSDDPNPQPRPSSWQAEVSAPGSVTLPVQCGSGPCERAFWLIGQLADGQADALDVAIEAGGSIQFMGSTWPSGAGASVTIEPPIAIAGPVPQLVSSTEREGLVLGPNAPAAARVVEVRIGADAIVGDGNPLGVLSVDLFGPRGTDVGYERQPIVHVYPLEGVEEGALGALPTPMDTATDPFTGCAAGVDCVRRFLVTFAWNGVEEVEEDYDWTLTVRRLDLVRAWSTRVELSTAVVRRIDVDPGVTPKPQHLEGEAQSVADYGDPQVAIGLGGTTTADERLAGLLPVPARMTWRIDIVGADPAATPDQRTNAYLTLPGERRGRQVSLTLAANDHTVVANPLGACLIGEVCPDLELQLIHRAKAGDAAPPPITAHWSLDVLAYSYVGIPVELTVGQRR